MLVGIKPACLNIDNQMKTGAKLTKKLNGRVMRFRWFKPALYMFLTKVARRYMTFMVQVLKVLGWAFFF